MGFTRAYASALSELYDGLTYWSLERVAPIRHYHGQIPLYDGSYKGKFVDPPGGVQGRYRFPQGTPRGKEGAEAMLREIQQALGASILLQEASSTE